MSIYHKYFKVYHEDSLGQQKTFFICVRFVVTHTALCAKTGSGVSTVSDY